MDDRQLSHLVRDLYPVHPASLDLASIERRARQISTRRRARRVVFGALAVILTIGGVVALRSDTRPGLQPVDSTEPTSSALTTPDPTTTAPTSTLAATTTTPVVATPLLGATVDLGTVPRFLSNDPTWTFTAFNETGGQDAEFSGGERVSLVLVGEGPMWDAPRLVVALGTGLFDRDDASTLGPIQDFEIGGQPGRFREATPAKGGFEYTWTIADGRTVWAASSGLTSDEATTLLSTVRFDGTAPTIDAPAGFRVLPDTSAPDGITFQIYEFTGEVALFSVECLKGTALLAGSLAYQPTRTVAVAGTEVGVRLTAFDAGPTGVTPLSASIFNVGDWYCQTMLMPPMVEGTTPPPNEWATDDEIQTLLGSLTLVDEDRFHQVVAPLPRPQVAGFSFT